LSSTATTHSPATRTDRVDVPLQGTQRVWGMIAEFDTPADIMAAAQKVRAEGFRYWDCHTPFPVHGLDKAMGVKRTILPVLVFGAGFTGLLAGLGLQIFTNSLSLSIWALVWVTGYPFLISGKPLLSIPAFIPVVFEVTVLLSALSAAGLMLLMNGLPRLYHPLFTSKRFLRATDDRFFISIEARDPRFVRSRTEAFLQGLGAKSVEVIED
jgi:hypothetical protein